MDTRQKQNELMIYSGIGARKCPDKILKQMTWLGEALGNKGWILRSGAAHGADAAFEKGCVEVGGECEIYLPWKNFNKHPSELYTPTKLAYSIAKKHHPAWSALNKQSKSFMARNTNQVLGELLFEPSDCVICYTPDGVTVGEETSKVTGGTGQAIRVASSLGIPVFNLKNEGALDQIVEFIKELE